MNTPTALKVGQRAIKQLVKKEKDEFSPSPRIGRPSHNYWDGKSYVGSTDQSKDAFSVTDGNDFLFRP